MTVDAHILRALREAGPGGVNGTDLAKRLGVSRAAVWARIEELRSLGYEIEASPHHGYRLLRSSDRLHADDLLARLEGPSLIGRDIQVFQETASTNKVLEKLAQEGVAEGLVVFAESQTQGRGRLGRSWVSPAGKGLWMSVLLRPDMRPQALAQVTLAAAASLATTIRKETGLHAEIKWPNDVVIKGRKTAGILTEVSAELDVVKYAIVGIGVNVNVEADDLPPEIRSMTTSLRLERGEPVHRPSLAAAILEELDRCYAGVRGRSEVLMDEWKTLCSTLGKEVTVVLGDRKVHGRAETLDSDGALLLRTDSGHLERIVGGDVTIEKKKGGF